MNNMARYYARNLFASAVLSLSLPLLLLLIVAASADEVDQQPQIGRLSNSKHADEEIRDMVTKVGVIYSTSFVKGMIIFSFMYYCIMKAIILLYIFHQLCAIVSQS